MDTVADPRRAVDFLSGTRSTGSGRAKEPFGIQILEIGTQTCMLPKRGLLFTRCTLQGLLGVHVPW